MEKREQELLSAAQEILSDFNTYGEILQVGDNGEYGTGSAIGRLSAAVNQMDKTDKEYACECCSFVKADVIWRDATEQYECAECYQWFLDNG